ncbi:MAG: methyltransferase, partial [Erysipelotrichaceae bacterium]
LRGTDIYLFQSDEMFKVNTDTYLLSQFMKIEKNDDVLDIGTNNGALLLYASQYHPGSLTGIDIIDRAIDIANINMMLNHIDNVNLINIDINNFDEEKKYDVITFNPPYFKGDNVNDNEYRKIARHQVCINDFQIVSNIKRLLKNNGHGYIVYRYDISSNLIKEIDNQGLKINRQEIYIDDRTNKKVSILLEVML